MTDNVCTNTTECVADSHMLCCPSTLRKIRAAEDLQEGDQVIFSDSRGVIAVAKIGATIPISRSMALDFGFLDPTPEERAEADRRKAELDAQRAVVAARIPTELVLLDTLTDPVSRLVLDLHRRTPEYGSSWVCAVCCDGGDMGDRVDWPCDTTMAVAAFHGIDLDHMWLFTRPADGSLDAPTPEDQ